MAKGRLIADVWKNHVADPFFLVLFEAMSYPYQVYYGREGWAVEPNRNETRAKYVEDRKMQCRGNSGVISSIDISGPMDEILKLIEFAGYHGCCGPARPRYLHVPKKSVVEVSGYLATRDLLHELAINDPTARLRSRQFPLDRPTRYDREVYSGNFEVITDRHRILMVGDMPFVFI